MLILIFLTLKRFTVISYEKTNSPRKMIKESEYILPSSWNQMANLSMEMEAAIRSFFFQKRFKSSTTSEAGEGMGALEHSHTVDRVSDCSIFWKQSVECIKMQCVCTIWPTNPLLLRTSSLQREEKANGNVGMQRNDFRMFGTVLLIKATVGKA